MRTSLLLLALLSACHNTPEDSIDEIGQAVCQPDQPPPCCPTCCDSPIVIDVAGAGLHLTSAVDGVRFELNPRHTAQWSWTESGFENAFLALDLDGDGTITSGVELFGNHTQQIASASPNGFLAMAWYDDPANGGNGDGTLNESDGVWPLLLLWTDRNHDGWASPSELAPVSTAVAAFSLNYKPSTEVDQNGNQYKYRSTLVPATGSTTSSVVTDAWLHTTPASAPNPQGCHTNWTCGAWTYASRGSEPYDPAHNECSIPSLTSPGGIPVLDVIDGLTYRFVYSLGFGGSQGEAAAQAEQRMDARMYQNANSYCTYGPIPSVDPHRISQNTQVINRVFFPPIRPNYSFQSDCGSELVCSGGCG